MPTPWAVGDVIGLACEVPLDHDDIQGKIHVSLNGSFAPPNGLVFNLASGLKGLYPAFTAQVGPGTACVRCNLGTGDIPFRYSPPGAEFKPMASFLAQKDFTRK